jgi:hypothetical protein
MTTGEMIAKFERLNVAKVKEIAIEAVHENEQIVIQDAITANIEGKTFAGNEINAVRPFSDWEESGEFHDNLSFLSKTDIEFTSKGDGAEAIFNSFSQLDTIAPTAKILSEEAIKDIRVSIIKKINAV